MKLRLGFVNLIITFIAEVSAQELSFGCKEERHLYIKRIYNKFQK